MRENGVRGVPGYVLGYAAQISADLRKSEF